MDIRKKNLLMISTDRNIFIEGSAVRARQIEYAKDWDEVHIIVFAKIGKSASTQGGLDSYEAALSSNCFAYSTRSYSKWLYPFDAIRLGRFIIEKRGITAITCQDPFLTGMAGASLKKQFGVPLELQIHTDIGSPNFTYTISNRFRKMLALMYVRRADTIRVVSERVKSYLTDMMNIDSSKITVRPIYVDIQKFKNAAITIDLHQKYPQFEKLVLMVSRLEPEKNIGMAIRAWATVIKQIPHLGLVIVGDGSQSEYLRTCASRLAPQNIILEPWADLPTIASYLKTADLYLLTSLFEGYGMTLVEAHAAGCPIVSTDVGVAKEVGAKIVGWDEAEIAEAVVYSLR